MEGGSVARTHGAYDPAMINLPASAPKRDAGLASGLWPQASGHVPRATCHVLMKIP